MIITQRSTSLSYSPDPVALGLRAVLTPRAARFASRQDALLGAKTSFDLHALYPALAQAERPLPFIIRTARAAAWRLSLVGTAAAIVTILHH